MKIKQFITNVSVLILVGATVLGSSASLQAKSITKKVYWSTNNKFNGTNKPCNNVTNSGNSNGVDNDDLNTDSSVNSNQKLFEDQVLALVNKERVKNGLSELSMDEKVRSVARKKSNDMYNKKYFSHTSPTYGSPFDMLKTFNIQYRYAGENIAQGYTTPEAVVKGWMNSSGHRANILNAKYTKIGIGYEANGNYWTQLFIG